MDHSNLGNRMKNYESVSKNKLMHRCPVILRLDGKAFHTFTHGFKKPFDNVIVKTMQDTMQYLCSNIQGCVFGYTQSDEISLILIDYKKLTSSSWFDYNVQKVCSVAAAMATLKFNMFFRKNAEDAISEINHDWHLTEEQEKLINVYTYSIENGAMFDCRAFNVPKDDVCNCILWRQQDATRNSIQAVAQANFSFKELQNKSCNVLQDMLFTQKGINWNDYPTTLKRGSCCITNETTLQDGTIKNEWIIDNEIPIFSQDRNYIEKYVFIN